MTGAAAHPRLVPLGGMMNFRDLGGIPLQGGGQTARGRVFRADAPHRMTEGDLAAVEALTLACVIDLRGAEEAAEAPGPLRDALGAGWHNVPLLAALDPASWGGAASDDVLLSLYLHVLTDRQEALAEVLRLIAEAPPEGAVLFHCTAGKDRTGVVAALLLALAGAPEEEIVADYSATAPLIAPLVAEILDRIRARGRAPEAHAPLLESRPETMRRFLAALREEFGGAEAYLSSIGLTGAERAGLRARLVPSSS
ncbi:tyrosine-protein phosphatase [Pseudoroseicyclus aestuarii]|uniref:Protein-tyrosine phosphatase n=1 Tax=Pseudoroseicyclus aestuarii TaxID=1795041 RepID=A0A318ST51_9RHOB|nr:tyrosine-protein phosphatase [Pseudoroseicyclus aestuarii]PYE84883.1 protein-tyrosine phosphatase [Pseudoroseicyclus aestuarii]